MDLEYDRNRGFDRRCRIRSNVIARSVALDIRRTELGHHDNFAVAFDSRIFGPAIVYGSHRHFHSAGEFQEPRTHVRLDRRRINPAIMRVATRMIVQVRFFMWLAEFRDSENNVLALMCEKPKAK
jgi:hypothetical protein